ncbi:FliO/MopB family protein [Selenomonas montiformis]|uniref:Flagellar biosynthetic protein FliO n=1 Tax=Selenomonas montiformis TaxID=2652285 RepID=A0A6I2UUM2_9FIRM|nr:flagellar biosynthetic protein FliO [Selenomonas montiformis]MDY4696596.1 flagellar biosynthetic protein FliO [Selenomonas montiformis]MSV24055.1 flagellar biosynthetic protein FliO [Selenomonas montiformis]
MKKQTIVLTVVAGGLLLLLMVDPALAADTAASGGYLAGYENADPRPSSISWWSTIAYLVSLFAIFAFVVGLAYFAARFLGGHFARQKMGYGGAILSHLPLGPNRSVCAVEMAGRVFLLGVTEHSITLLSEITDPEEIDRLRREGRSGPPVPEMFSQQFGTLSELVRKVPPLFRK